MNNIYRTKWPRALLLALALAAGQHAAAQTTLEKTSMQTAQTLSPKQQAIAPIAAFMASGQMAQLQTALGQGLDAGLSVNDCKEILVQLYAYAGFPRSLNALNALMAVLEQRKARGIEDAQGIESEPAPEGEALLAAGTANQTRLVGAPVKGPLFDFAPQVDRYLKTHLFGDIFARSNLDWQSRELATVAALAAMSGLEAQLLSHVKVSLNVGLSVPQLRQFFAVLAAQGSPEAAQRAQAALRKAGHE